MSYQHLTTFERARIETLMIEGFTMRCIAIKLGRNVSTISRELKRNSTQKVYISEFAQDLYGNRRKRCGRKSKWSMSLAATINEKLKHTWSPEQIANRLFRQALCTKTIYRWIYLGFLQSHNLSLLRHKGKRRQPRETRGRFNVGVSIHHRPKEIRKRQTFGHWELDTVVSSRGKSKGCLATFVERKTRWYTAIKMTDRSAKSMEAAIGQLRQSLPAGSMQTATVDRGKEFACFPIVEKNLKLRMYFADPYSSWQRGSNENANGLLREFFPKKTDLSKVSTEQVALALSLINNRPKKCLNWKTAHEAFQEEMLHLY